MSRLALGLILLVSVLVGTARSADNSPLPAHVATKTAQVRSGPGSEYYVTLELTEGTAVEVYRMIDGWCGIRPPEGSFSYVLADHVRPSRQNEDVLVTVVANAKTRVGSQLSSKHHVEYIALKKNELLRRIGDVVQLGSPLRSWYRVAPPSGEFRWMRLSDLDIGPDRPAAEVAAPLKAHDDHVATVALSTAEPMATDNTHNVQLATVRAPLAATEPIDQVALDRRPQMKTEPIPVAEPATDELPPMDPVKENDGPAAASEATASTSDGTWVAVGTSTLPIDRRTKDPDLRQPARQLAKLELELSQTVVGEADSWRLASLQRDTRQLRDTTTDPTTRAGAERLLDRIQDFVEVQQRHHQITAQSTQAAPVRLASASQPLTAAHRSASLTVARGWLLPVLNSADSKPTYALTSAAGEILYFVTSASDVPLGRFLNQSVVVHGRLQAQDRLQAESVARIDANRRGRY